MTKDEALRMALKSLEFYYDLWKEKVDAQTITAIREALAQSEFVLNGIDCSCGRKWRVVNNTLTASEQPEQESDDLTAAYLSGVYDGKNKYALQRKQGQEPVEWDGKCVLGHCGSPAGCEDSDCCRADFTTPPQRKPLTDEQCINQMLNSGFERNSLGWSFTYGRLDYHLLKFARAIEAAHGIKE